MMSTLEWLLVGQIGVVTVGYGALLIVAATIVRKHGPAGWKWIAAAAALQVVANPLAT